MEDLFKFTVIGTETYLKEVNKLPKNYLEMVEKIPSKLAENPFSGSPLSYIFLREKRINEKRIYYLVYEDLKLVLLVAVSGKKDQQLTIDHIKENLKEFRIAAEQLSQSFKATLS